MEREAPSLGRVMHTYLWVGDPVPLSLPSCISFIHSLILSSMHSFTLTFIHSLCHSFITLSLTASLHQSINSVPGEGDTVCSLRASNFNIHLHEQPYKKQASEKNAMHTSPKGNGQLLSKRFRGGSTEKVLFQLTAKMEEGRALFGAWLE